MSLVLTNSLTRRKDLFVPADPARVSMYVCGPTVYNYAHVGNARPAVVFDVLYRLLKRRFANVIYARNFTDVDDKINAAASAVNEPISVLTARYIDAYHADMAALGVLAPDLEPRVTEHIPDIVNMIERLIAREHAYVAEDHVLFHVPSYSDYGLLAGRSQDEMVAGARVEVAPFKRHPSDFVLWKPSTQDLPGWPSPWGRGRPGWHIECSAMIERHLGPSIDIHGGGLDLIFPHHENEIAQGTCAHDGQLYCGYWVHNGFVTVEGRKMSKSLGNILLVRDLLEQAPGEAIRFALLGAHYRQPLDWSGAALERARRGLDRLYTVLRDLEDVPLTPVADERLRPFETALNDDLNFPAAIAELFGLAKTARQATSNSARAQAKSALLRAGADLGLLQQSPETWLSLASPTRDHAATIDQLIKARHVARAERDFAAADRIRGELAELGITVEDRKEGTFWRRTGV